MNDAGVVTIKLAELLRQPDDLDKIPALKAEFARKKAAIDAQLRLGLQEQLNVTQSGMTSISDGQRTVELIKAEMQKIDKLCAEAQNQITDFPHINLVSQTHRNFSLVETMKNDIDEFGNRLLYLEELLKEDDADLETQPNLLAIHYELTKLRDIKDSALDQVKRAGEAGEELVNNLTLSTGATLQEYFAQLTGAVEWFDEHIRLICDDLINQVIKGNNSLVVRLALVIEEEEKGDKKARALQEARHEYKELASRFKSITTNNKEIRGYKEKFLESIENGAADQFIKANAEFQENPEKLASKVAWWFNDLNAVKLGMAPLMPKKWKIFQSYTMIYHKLMHDWLISLIDDPELRPPQMLAIVNWSVTYYEKTKRLGIQEDWLRPHVIDDRASELIREYRQLIVKAVDEWMDRMAKTDSLAFNNRDENGIDQDEHGCFRTKALADMWRMLSQQLDVASSSQRTDIVEGVVDAMFRTLRSRQQMWERLIDTDLAKYKDPNSPQDGYQALQDWLVALANDQIACIDDDSESGLGYLTRFQQDVQQQISDEYSAKSTSQIEVIRMGYIDLSTHCLAVFASLIFAVDFRVLLAEFFTKDWYSKFGMKQAISTFEDYLTDYRSVLHPLLHDNLAAELSDTLLASYLSCVKNKGVKFRRSDPFAEKFRDDIVTVFGFIDKCIAGADIVKEKWRAVEGMVDLIEADKASLPDVYERFRQQYWDAGISWVEAVLKSRDDYDRAMLKAVKDRANEMEVIRGEETIMSKVK
jgi:exocyst complex component 3